MDKAEVGFFFSGSPCPFIVSALKLVLFSTSTVQHEKNPLFSCCRLYLGCIQVMLPLLSAFFWWWHAENGDKSFSGLPAAQLKRAGKTGTKRLFLSSRFVFHRVCGNKSKGRDVMLSWICLLGAASPPLRRQPGSNAGPFLD